MHRCIQKNVSPMPAKFQLPDRILVFCCHIVLERRNNRHVSQSVAVFKTKNFVPGSPIQTEALTTVPNQTEVPWRTRKETNDAIPAKGANDKYGCGCALTGQRQGIRRLLRHPSRSVVTTLLCLLLLRHYWPGPSNLAKLVAALPLARN